MECKSLDLETCVLLPNKKWLRQSIFSLDFFFYNKSQNVTFCDVYQLAFLELNTYSSIWWLQQLISLDLFVLFYLFAFLENNFFLLPHAEKKKIWFPSEQEIKRYDHGMTSRVNFSVIFSRHVHNSQNRIHHLRHLSKNIPMKVLKEIKRNWMSFYHLATYIYSKMAALYVLKTLHFSGALWSYK